MYTIDSPLIEAFISGMSLKALEVADIINGVMLD